jgi:hypothetical protein
MCTKNRIAIVSGCRQNERNFVKYLLQISRTTFITLGYLQIGLFELKVLNSLRTLRHPQLRKRTPKIVRVRLGTAVMQILSSRFR